MIYILFVLLGYFVSLLTMIVGGLYHNAFMILGGLITLSFSLLAHMEIAGAVRELKKSEVRFKDK